MQVRSTIFPGALLLMVIMSSCLTNRKLTYLQQTDEIPAGEITVTSSSYRIMPNDILFIRLVTPDPQWSEIFNPQMGTGGSLTQESASLWGYNVDDNGFIEIPYIGKISVGGKTVSDIKVELDEIFHKYVADGSVTVRMVNNFVSVIGEVNSPGRYPLTKDRINIFEALALAGDLNDFSNRREVQLIRPTNAGTVIKEFSLRDRNILTSEYYYVMPNDIIYAKPMKGRNFQMNTPVVTLLLSTITTGLVIFSYITRN
jgi:polysaccharide biosynthesis/export protein